MSKQITLTVPDLVHEALTRKGKILECGPGEVLKQWALMSAQGAEVALGLKAQMEAVEMDRKTTGVVLLDQYEIPLGGGQASAGGVRQG